MQINDKEITAKEFGWDECHKIYLVNTEQDKKELLDLEYKLFPIDQLEQAWKDSCELKFISNADLVGKNIVDQFEKAIFS